MCQADASWDVNLLKGHVLASGIVVVAVTSVGAVFAFAAPAYHRQVMPGPPNNDLPYTVVSYTSADARRAFAAEGINLSPRAKSPTTTTLGNRGDILEVDVFGDPEKVKQTGFYDYTIVNDHYAHFPRDCSSGGLDAELWQGNVRVIVNCSAAGSSSRLWLRRAERAIAHL